MKFFFKIEFLKMILILHNDKWFYSFITVRYEFFRWEMLSIICIFMKELLILVSCHNNSLFFFYINSKFCFIEVSDVLILYIKLISSCFVFLKSFFKILNIMWSFSFICKRMRSLYLIFRIMLKKSCRSVISHYRRFNSRIKMILCENPVHTTLKLSMS